MNTITVKRNIFGYSSFFINHFKYKNINSMKKFKTYQLTINNYTDNVSISVPPFSKVLDVNIIDNLFVILVEIDTLHEYDTELKSFFFQIKKELEFEAILPIGYEFLKTIIIDKPYISNSGINNNSSVNISLDIINDNEIYRIFISEIKTITENRDSKITNLLEE